MGEKGNILITGAGRGLGKALTEVFLQNGFRVLGLMRRAQQATQFSGAAFIPVIADITDDACGEALMNALGGAPLQLLINNAGIGGRSSRLREVDTRMMHLLFDTHCVGPLRVTRACLENLLQSGSGTVININSRMGSVSSQYDGRYGHLQMTYEYRIAKAAQNMLSACIKHEFGNRLRVYQVHPGRIKTETSQVDANLEPREAAMNIFRLWQEKRLVEASGIFDAETGGIIHW